jgi:hypothetical protein
MFYQVRAMPPSMDFERMWNNMQTNSSKVKQINTKTRKPYNMQEKQEKQHKTKRVDKRQAFVFA